MLTIKSIVVKNMKRIALIMVTIILFISTLIQIFSMHEVGRQNARQIFEQVGQILDENFGELERVQEEYKDMCLNDARIVAYILKCNPDARDDVNELKKIASDVEVDEIHIFDTDGVIVGGTHPEYFGYSFDSGEQIGFFKPLLEDKSIEIVQEITPNTADPLGAKTVILLSRLVWSRPMCFGRPRRTSCLTSFPFSEQGWDTICTRLIQKRRR